jgi:hypothetical protein
MYLAVFLPACGSFASDTRQVAELLQTVDDCHALGHHLLHFPARYFDALEIT